MLTIVLIFLVSFIDWFIKLGVFNQLSQLSLKWWRILALSGLYSLLTLVFPDIVLYLEPLYFLVYLLVFQRSWTWSQSLFYGLVPFVLVDLFQRTFGIYHLKWTTFQLWQLSLEWLDFIFVVVVLLMFIPFYRVFIRLMGMDIQHMKKVFVYPKFKKSLRNLIYSMVFYVVVVHTFLILGQSVGEMDFSVAIGIGDSQVYLDFIKIYFAYFIGSLFFLNTKLKELLTEELQEAKDAQLSSLEDYSQHVESLYKDIRSFRHDYTNILVSLNEAIKQEDVSEIRAIYQTVLVGTDQKFYQDAYDIGNLAHLDNTAMKSILSAKLMEAQSRGIQLTVEIEEASTAPVGIELLDMVTILSIFLDNAIEAASLSAEKSLLVAYFEDQGEKILIIENSTVEERIQTKSIFSYGKSSKGEGRGIGLANVQKILSHYPSIRLVTTSQAFRFRQELHMPHTLVK
ncbi:TPA: sensor histidine kinase [Streptococcus suis]